MGESGKAHEAKVQNHCKKTRWQRVDGESEADIASHH